MTLDLIELDGRLLFHLIDSDGNVVLGLACDMPMALAALTAVLSTLRSSHILVTPSERLRIAYALPHHLLGE